MLSCTIKYFLVSWYLPAGHVHNVILSHQPWSENETFSLAVFILSSADNLCKWFRPRSGPTECRSWSGSKNIWLTLWKFSGNNFLKTLITKKVNRRQHCLLITFANSLWTQIRTDRMSILIWIQNHLTDTMKVFLKELFEKSQQKTTLSADNLCKQFGPRSGPTQCQSWSGSKPFDTLIVFLKELFENLYFEKKSAVNNIFCW